MEICPTGKYNISVNMRKFEFLTEQRGIPPIWNGLVLILIIDLALVETQLLINQNFATFYIKIFTFYNAQTFKLTTKEIFLLLMSHISL